MRPLATYWPSSPGSIDLFIVLFLDQKILSQLSLSRGVFAVLPQHPLPVLHYVFGDERDDVLTVVVESDLADDRVLVAGLVQLVDHLFAVGSDILDHVEDQARRGEGERAVGFGRLVVFR